jgi:hypothetical protein
MIASFQGAYALDAKPAAVLTKLVAFYQMQSTIVNDPTLKTPVDIFKQHKKAITVLLGEPTEQSVTIAPNLRKTIAVYNDKVLPVGAASLAPLTPEMRATINNQFLHVAAALKGVQP